VRHGGVLLAVRHMTKRKEGRGTEQQTWGRILQRFAENDDIALAYPSSRY
jgi:hypothetical protein